MAGEQIPQAVRPAAEPVIQGAKAGLGALIKRIFPGARNITAAAVGQQRQGTLKNLLTDNLKREVDSLLKSITDKEIIRDFRNFFGRSELPEKLSPKLLDRQIDFLLSKNVKLTNFGIIPQTVKLLSEIRAYATLHVPSTGIKFRFSASTLERLAKEGGEQPELILKLERIIGGKDPSSFLSTSSDGLQLNLIYGRHTLKGALASDGIYTF